MLYQFSQLDPSNAIGAIYSDCPSRFPSLHNPFVRSRELLIVSSLSRLPVLVWSVLCVCAAHQVVELRSCEDFVIYVVCAGCLQSVNQSRHQSGTGFAGISRIDDICCNIRFYLQGSFELLIYFEESFVCRGVGQLGCIDFPGRLA